MKYTILGHQNKVIGTTDSVSPEDLQKFYDEIKSGHTGKLKNEFFEILGQHGERTGNIKPRDLVHSEGDWHGAFHLHVYTREDSATYLLLQKRKHDKDICPNKLDTVAAGHYAIGESIEDGVREVEEEIGLGVKFNELTLLGKRKNYDPQPKKGIFNFEFQYIAVYECNQPIEAYKLQEDELAGILKVNVRDFIDLMMQKRDSLQGVESLLFNQSGTLEKTDMTVTREDIWPAPFDNYYLKTAFLVSMLSEGKNVPDKPYELDVTTFF